MTMYLVVIEGSGMQLRTDAGDVAAGFVKNEYVWAPTEADAETKATTRVLNGLRRNAGVRMQPEEFRIEVTGIERVPVLSNLLKHEGFVFYPMDSQ